jgi:hypothetical protein
VRSAVEIQKRDGICGELRLGSGSSVRSGQVHVQSGKPRDEWKARMVNGSDVGEALGSLMFSLP